MKVAIVEGGIAGLSTAWALTKRGHDVTLIEQGPLPNSLADSGDEHSMIRSSSRPVPAKATNLVRLSDAASPQQLKRETT